MSYRRFIPLLLLIAAMASAQQDIRRGTITYISGDVIYCSLGRTAGLEESSLMYVLRNGDTVATLKVFALSSSSSASRPVSTNATLRVSDPVIAFVNVPSTAGIPADEQTSALADSSRALLTPSSVPRDTVSQSPLFIDGRIAYQYIATIRSERDDDIAQPALLLALRGGVHRTPITFELYGSIRFVGYGTLSPIPSSGQNQSRIYSAAVRYDDSIITLSLGRFAPRENPSVGYIDGISIARRVGLFAIGGSLGFEPDYVQRTLSTERRKVSAFASFAARGSHEFAVSLGYARTYFHSTLDREVVESSLLYLPSSAFFVSGRGEIDLRVFRHQRTDTKPVATLISLLTNYRPSELITVGAGFSASRPSYPASVVSAIPDSFVDRKLRTSPSLSLSICLPGRITISDSYADYLHDQQPGKEFLNSLSVGVSDLFRQGLSLRSSLTAATNSSMVTHSYFLAMHKLIGGIVDASLRLQQHRYIIRRTDERLSSHSIACDLLFMVTRQLSMWGSYERFSGYGSPAHQVRVELSWRF